MPIKPENRHSYPADWPAIRERVLQRAQMRCEHPGCGARQYDVGYWGAWGGGPVQWLELERNLPTYAQARQRAAEHHWDRYGDGPGVHKIIVIVLTIAHLDHVPEHCDLANLRALCQRHHLAHDHDHHRANAHATRRARLAAGELF